MKHIILNMPDEVYEVLAPTLDVYVVGIESYPVTDEEIKQASEEEIKQASEEYTDLLARDIRSFVLSARAVNAFRSEDVWTLGDAINLGREAYKHLRNVGKLTMSEVDLMMFDLGLYEKWEGDKK